MKTSSSDLLRALLSEQKTLNSINRSIIITVSHMANIMFMVIMDMTANCFGEMLPL